MFDFSDPKCVQKLKTLRIRKKSSWSDLVQEVSEKFDISADNFRLWCFVNRQNKTVRPDTPCDYEPGILRKMQ